SSSASKGSGLGSTVLILGLVAVVVLFMIFNSRSTKKRQQEAQNKLDAIRPGNKVKTIGGICGVVVEVNPEDNTFVLETGTEASGKSYLKFDKQAVYQTDAVVNPAPAQAEEKQETVEETVEEPKEEPVAETEEKAE
ncbi:MAG: preprotein translocase subunit YajC, partial [Clostridia bacterium]|nr:preprotein translocase subunit YajC [Clostridia bacterium]